MKTINIDGEQVKINTQPSNARKSIDIEFKPGEIIVKIPRGRKVDIDAILTQRHDLLIRKYREAKSKIKLLHGDTIHIAGEPREITVKTTSNPPDPRITIQGNTLTIHAKEEENPQELLKTWIADQTQLLIPQILEKHGLQIPPDKIRIQYTPRWGQCTKKGNIAYNWQLSTLPPHLAEYTIIHEAIHLQHFHHQKGFHKKLEKTLPNHRQHEKELQKYIAIPANFPYQK